MRIIALTACLYLLAAFAAKAQDQSRSNSVQGLSIRMDSTNVTAPLRLDCALTNRLPALPVANTTTFLDPGGTARLQSGQSKSNLLDLYCVLLVPDFWSNPGGAVLDGGPQKSGADFLPIYTGTPETDEFLRPFVLHVDLVVDSERATEEEAIDLKAAVDDAVERVNLGTLANPSWAYATGFWLQHDLLANGPHTLQLRTLVELNTLVGPGEQFLTVTNASVRVLTTNAVTFSDWGSGLGGSLKFAGKSTEPRVNWRIEIRDSKDHLLTTKTGSTTNGNITWIWDQRDNQGKLHDDLQSDPYFLPSVTTWPLGQSSPGEAREKPSITGQANQSWWVQRLGHDFVRKRPPHKTEYPGAKDEPSRAQLKARPLDLSNPAH